MRSKTVFLPDCLLDSFRSLKPEMLQKCGITLLVCDIDNTLVTYDDPTPTPAVLEWLQTMTDAGIRVAFCSNNEEKRVKLFHGSLPYPAMHKAHKPRPGKLRNLIRMCGATPDTTAVIGDQIFTDVLMAHFAGAKAYLVPPIKDRTDWFHRLKRLGEKPFLRRYARKHPQK